MTIYCDTLGFIDPCFITLLVYSVEGFHDLWGPPPGPVRLCRGQRFGKTTLLSWGLSGALKHIVAFRFRSYQSKGGGFPLRSQRGGFPIDANQRGGVHQFENHLLGAVAAGAASAFLETEARVFASWSHLKGCVFVWSWYPLWGWFEGK